MALPYKPQRTFNGAEGAASVGDAGPTGIKNDTNEIVAMFDPLAVHGDGTVGGISIGNLATGEATATPTAGKIVLYDASGNLPGSIASAANVTTNINGHAITDILESDGVTVKNATLATTATLAEAAKGDTRFQISFALSVATSIPGNDSWVVAFRIAKNVPSGKVLKIKRLCFLLSDAPLRVMVHNNADNINITSTGYYGEETPDFTLSNSSGVKIIYIYIKNTSASSVTASAGSGGWIDFAIE